MAILAQVVTLALNSYREAVRARLLHGLAALAVATALYSVVVGAFALRNASRVVSDVGSASISIYAVIVAIIIGATSLYRELEQKTIFPILARPISRGTYLAGKYFGTLATLATFIGIDATVVMLILAHRGGRSVLLVGGVAAGLLGSALVTAWRFPRFRTYVPLVWAAPALALAWLLAAGAIDDRRVVLASALLTLCEVMIVAGMATLFSAFSSPFLTAVFTTGLFVVGREADTLAKLPARVFGQPLHQLGVVLSQLVPNLQTYVPPRPLLTGEAAGSSIEHYLALGALHAAAWSLALLVLAHAIFRRRDVV